MQMKYQVRKHGTTTGYQYGCRCDRCRAAQAAMMRERRYGRGASRMCSADVVRRHLIALRAAGFGILALEELSGVGHTTICRVLYTTAPVILQRTADRLLALQPDRLQDHATFVSAAPMWAAIDRLVERGYPKRLLEKMLCADIRMSRQKRPRRVTATKAYRVIRLCEEIEAGRIRR